MLRHKNKYYSSEIGASYIEFALVSPLLLLFIFTAVFLTHLHLAESTLSSALGKVRLAHTRGGEDLSDLVLIDAIDQYKSGNITNEFKAVFASPDIGASGWGNGGFYDQVAKTVYHPSANSSDIPDPVMYSYAYIHSEMIASLGSWAALFSPLSFPCESSQPGCLKCMPINPETSAPTAPSGPPAPWLTGNSPYPAGIAGMECSYHLSNVFVDPVIKMLDLITGNSVSQQFVITKRKVFYTSS